MKIHIVKKGDTLYELAQKYNIELDKLIAANPQIPDPNVLDIGMKVKIPHSPKPITPPTDYLYKHVVVQGDSLWKLGKAWGIPLADMIAANPQLKNPNVLMTGDVIYIPKLNPEPSQKQVAGANPKADTSQIVPEAPLPMEVPSISEQAVEQPNIMMQQIPAMEKPKVSPIQAIPQMPNVGMQQAPAMVQPNVSPIQAIPPMPYMGVQQAPAKELPYVSPSFGVPHLPNAMPVPTGMQSNEPFGMHEAVLPYYMKPHPDWQTGVHPMEGENMNMPPSADLFQQYNVPVTEVMAYDMEPSKGKEKENEWKQPEQMPMPSMQTMPTADSLPMPPNLPSSAEMPYYAPHTAYPPLFPSMEGPHLGGDCGCGPLQLPYALPMAAGYPGVPPAGEPYMPYSFHTHGMSMMPYGTGAYPSYEPMAGVNAYPGISPYAGVAGPGAPFSVPYPWGTPEDYGYHDKHQTKGDKGKSREEKADVSQTEPKPTYKRPGAAAKRKSARATISSLIKRHNQRARSTEKVRKASPWINH